MSWSPMNRCLLSWSQARLCTTYMNNIVWFVINKIKEFNGGFDLNGFETADRSVHVQLNLAR